MDIVEFLSHDSLTYPGHRAGRDVRDYLRERFDQFTAFVSSVSPSDKYVRRVQAAAVRIEEQGDLLLESLEAYFQGHVHRAYDALNNAIKTGGNYFSRLSTTQKPDHWINATGLFRARTAYGDHFGREDLFHVPFELRTSLTPKRYSRPGLPALYLCNSTYLCWEELQRPPLNSISVARFELDSTAKLRFLTVGPPPIWLIQQLKVLSHKHQQEHSLVKFVSDTAVSVLICWPIILACSLRVHERNAPFIPEYILPQLLLTWVTANDDVDGIQYASLAIDHRKIPLSHGLNYIFPAKSKRNTTGQCAILKKHFRLTAPVSWELVRASGHLAAPLQYSSPNSHPPKQAIELLDGRSFNYDATEFGRMERFLANGETKKLP